MSDYERHKGVIKLINYGHHLNEEDRLDLFLNYFKLRYPKANIDSIKSNRSSYIVSGTEYLIIGGDLYEVVDKEIKDDPDTYLELNQNGTDIEYTARFYNGGTDLHEMLCDKVFDFVLNKKHADKIMPG